MNYWIKLFIYVTLGFLLGHFGLSGLLFFDMTYSATIGFISLLITFIIVLSNKNNFINLLYLMVFSLGSFTGIEFEIPQAIASFLSISKNDLWGLSFLIGIHKLYVAYIILFLKVFFVDHNNIITKSLNRIPFELKVIFYALILTFLQLICEHVLPAQAGYILNEHVSKLNLLSLIGISGYSYFITFICLYVAFSIKEKKYKVSSSLFFIILFIVFNHNYSFNGDDNYNSSKKLNTRIIQYPFHKIEKTESFPDNFIREELFPIIEYSEVDLILLPEASLPYVYKDYKEFSKLLLLKDIRKYKKNVQFSLFKKEGDKIYNASILYKYNRLPEFYYKEQLFPIGEYTPRLYKGIISYNSNWVKMDKKENKERLFTIKNINYLPLLCFENYNASLFRRTNKIWSFVTVQSNESWLFDGSFRKYLLNFSKIRAREFNTYLLKSDTSGPSFIINNKGESIVVIEKEKEFYDYKIPEKVTNNHEYYYKYRDLMIFVIALIQFLLFFTSFLLKRLRNILF